MKSFTFFLCMLAMSMVASAHFVQLIYTQNGEPAIHQYGRCVPFLNAAGKPPLSALVVAPTTCAFFNDNTCQTRAQNLRPLNLDPRKIIPIPQASILPKGIYCRRRQ